MRTAYHHTGLKTALLAYAREQLEHAGLDSVSMREMAKAVNVSHTAAYRHFADKRALLDAVAVQGFEEMHQACVRAVADAAATPRDRLIACGLAYVRFGLDNPKLLVHLFTSIAQAEASDDVVQAGAILFGSLQQLVHEGQTQGAFRAGDTRALSHACWAMVHGLAALLSIQPGMFAGQSPARPDKDALMQSARVSLDLFLDSLALTPARP